MDDEINIIHQNPLGLTPAFNRVGVNTKLTFQAKFHLVGNRDVLSFVRAIADEEVVGEATLGWVKREDADIFSFLVFAGGGGGEQ